MKCYGRNLATSRMVQMGETVGVIAAQSIGEPGTQLTLRTFHVGGVASNASANTGITSKYSGKLEIDELRTVDVKESDGTEYQVVIGRMAEMRILDTNTNTVLTTQNIPYGSKLFVKNGSVVEKGTRICEWDPFNALIVTEVDGKIVFVDMDENVTYKTEVDEATNMHDKIIIESKDKAKVPAAQIVDAKGNVLKTYNLPVGAHMVVDDGEKVQAGQQIVKIPRVASGGAGDITGGLPRVTELFEARNPSNPAIVSEIDGQVTFGKIKRGNREIAVTSKTGEEKKYLVPLAKQILVQENDYVRAGTPLSDGAVTPSDILSILGPTAVQEYIVNEVQAVYRLQGVKINDKHFEIIVRQMMRKVQITNPGDTEFLQEELVDKWDFMDANDNIFGKYYVLDAGDSQRYMVGDIIDARDMRNENSSLERQGRKMMAVREANPATAKLVLQGITRAALRTNSFISAASFQETTKVLSEAAIRARVDHLEGLKENVICGHLIPAGTGQKEFQDIIVGRKDEYEQEMNEL